MGWVPILFSVTAAFLLFKAGHTLLMVCAIVAVVGCFWSWGVMHNYATELAKIRLDYSGEFNDITKREAKATPDWIAVVNMIFSLIGLALLITGLVLVGTGL